MTHRKDGSEIDNPWERSSEYKARARHWELPDDLLGGTLAMRERGQKWLPKEEAESDKAYKNRVHRSFLEPGYKRAIAMLSKKPFSKPTTVSNGEDLYNGIMGGAIDLQGTSLTQFGEEILESAIHRGISYIFIDMPATGGTQTSLEERNGSVRPFFRHISAKDLIGWTFDTDVNTGLKRLSQVRIRESVDVKTGEYSSEKREQVRVWNAGGTWEVWQSTTENQDGTNDPVENDDGGWLLEAEGTHTFNGVPMVAVILDENGEPVLEDLAFTNLAHWQSSSDQRNILRYARTGTIFAKNFTDEEVKSISIGANQVVAASSADASLDIVEYQGASIEAGERDLKQLEAKMNMMGSQPFTEKTTLTATEVAASTSSETSVIQSWVLIVEDSLEHAFAMAAQWINQELPEDFKVNIFDDFALGVGRKEDLDALAKARALEDISVVEYRTELKRRGVLSEDVDAEAIPDNGDE